MRKNASVNTSLEKNEGVAILFCEEQKEINLKERTIKWMNK